MTSAVVETALGLCLVFYLTALFTAGVVEWSAALVNKRAKALLVGVQELLNPSTDAFATANPLRQLLSLFRASLSAGYLDRLVRGIPGGGPSWLSFVRHAVGWKQPPTGSVALERVMAHSLIQPFKKARLGSGKTGNPSYIPADVFARALLDTAGAVGLGGADANTPASALVQRLVRMTGDSGVDPALRALAKAANGNVDAFLNGVQDWYSAQMDRVTGAYKRWAKRLGALVAVVVVGVLHIDALAVTQSLWSHDALRASIVATANVATACNPPAQSGDAKDQPVAGDQTGGSAKTPAECALAKLDEWGLAGLPIGIQEWRKEVPSDGQGWAMLLLGLGISVMATSMGAPFWFATVNRLVNVRNAGTPPKEAL